MGTWKSVAEIQIDQIILVAHQVAAQFLVAHLHDQVLVTLLVAQHALIQVDLHRVHQDQIQIDVVKIYRRVVGHLRDQVRQGMKHLPKEQQEIIESPKSKKKSIPKHIKTLVWNEYIGESKAESLCKVWPRYFPDMATAKAYEKQPERIANRAYGNRMGNGPSVRRWLEICW